MNNMGKETNQLAKEPPPAELSLGSVAIPAEIRISIRSHADIATARQKANSLATELNFSSAEAILLAAVVSELARNMVTHATRGEVRLKVTHGDAGPNGVQVIGCEDGPGISDIDQGLRDGFSTSGSLGVELPTLRHVVDEFQVDSAVSRGTTVTVTKRRRPLR
jgi:serine/threonine-protein kinase RsbT